MENQFVPSSGIAQAQQTLPVQTEPVQAAPIPSDALVVCRGLVRRFGSIPALDGFDLTLTGGKLVGLLGPNGAGKTTLIKILNGLLQPDSGLVLVDGNVPGVETKKVVSYLPDRPYFADWMKVGDMLDLFCDFYDDFDMLKANEMCSVLGLNSNMRIKSLSKGTREKMQLMLVMSRRAKLYLLDEPIAGVDPAAREFIMHTILSNYHEGGTVLVSTHLISDIQSVLNEAVIISGGRIAVHDTVDGIRERTGKSVDELFRELFRMNYAAMGGAFGVR